VTSIARNGIIAQFAALEEVEVYGQRRKCRAASGNKPSSNAILPFTIWMRRKSLDEP
jgi:hypothetical protein